MHCLFRRCFDHSCFRLVSVVVLLLLVVVVVVVTLLVVVTAMRLLSSDRASFSLRSGPAGVVSCRIRVYHTIIYT